VAINGYIVSREPWKMYKQNGADETLSRVIWNVLESLRIVLLMVAPVMPSTTREALQRIGSDSDAIGIDDLQWGRLPNTAPVRVADPIFPRADAAAYFGEKKMSEQSGPPIETTQATPPDAARISIDEFMKIDLRVAEIRAAEKVEKSKKLLKLRVFTGDGERTLVAGIATKYTPEELIGRKVVVVTNLQPAKLMGIESNGMVLAASIDGEPSLLSVDPDVPAGTKVK
jgi:methionyl-tRNA synthetase